MPVTINTKPRSDLKTYFRRGTRPTEAQFGEFIDGVPNVKDDGLYKTGASPLQIQAESNAANSLQRVVEFYKSFADPNPAWTLQLKPSVTSANSGLGFQRNNNTVLFLDEALRIGVKTTTPAYDLDINGSVKLGAFTQNETTDEWPLVVWSRDTAVGWDEGLLKVAASRTGNNKAGFAIHFHESRSFSFFTTGPVKVLNIQKNRITTKAGIIFENQPLQWNPPDYPNFGQISDQAGNASIFNDGSSAYNALMIMGRMTASGRRYMQLWDDADVKGNMDVRGHMTVGGRLTPSVGSTSANGITFPENPGRGGGDEASIRYFTRAGESTTLEIKNVNDQDDNIELIASGTVITRNSHGISDQRQKKNIAPLEYGLNEIKRLNPVSFDWKNQSALKKNIGLLAQDVETVINEVIYEYKKDENNSELCISYNSLIPILINAIKELDQKLSEVKLTAQPSKM